MLGTLFISLKQEKEVLQDLKNEFYRSVMHNARFNCGNFMVLVGMEGFEPTQAVPPDLQSGPIHHHWSIPDCVSARILHRSNIPLQEYHIPASLSTKVLLE